MVGACNSIFFNMHYYKPYLESYRGGTVVFNLENKKHPKISKIIKTHDKLPS